MVGGTTRCTHTYMCTLFTGVPESTGRGIHPDTGGNLHVLVVGVVLAVQAPDSSVHGVVVLGTPYTVES